MHATLVHTHTCWQCAFTSCIISFFEFCQYTNKKKIVTNSLSNKSNNNGRQQQRSSMLHAMAKEFTVRNDRDADDIAWMDIEENVEKEEQPREERERPRWLAFELIHTHRRHTKHSQWLREEAGTLRVHHAHDSFQVSPFFVVVVVCRSSSSFIFIKSMHSPEKLYIHT